VNLGGVVNGIQAAYAVMMRQGFGHMSTASWPGSWPHREHGICDHQVCGGRSIEICGQKPQYGVRVGVCQASFVRHRREIVKCS
jgi:hypothetical protein